MLMVVGFAFFGHEDLTEEASRAAAEERRHRQHGNDDEADPLDPARALPNDVEADSVILRIVRMPVVRMPIVRMPVVRMPILV